MEIRFYEDPIKKVINMDLMSDDAQKWALKVSKAGLNAKGDKLEKNKISQLRKFYDEAIRLSAFIKDGEDYRNIIPYIKMLKAKAAYAEGRKLVTTEFNDFITRAIAEVKVDDTASFELFLSFFEAFMGFYKFEESKYK
ncbi:MAG TPA: type III-A CRISPR-associated protein Csm2 [Desulfuromonadales bacterium]|nr:type III-A CRISPR-associated protein Csm2 [Desulfuromonadales bacterium]